MDDSPISIGVGTGRGVVVVPGVEGKAELAAIAPVKFRTMLASVGVVVLIATASLLFTVNLI